MSKCIDCRAPMSDFDARRYYTCRNCRRGPNSRVPTFNAPKRVESEREPWEATRELEGTIHVEREGGE